MNDETEFELQKLTEALMLPWNDPRSVRVADMDDLLLELREIRLLLVELVKVTVIADKTDHIGQVRHGIELAIGHGAKPWREQNSEMGCRLVELELMQRALRASLEVSDGTEGDVAP